MSTLPFAYEVQGTGDTIIFIHAGICDRRMWDEHAAFFTAAGYQVARHDMRGWGESHLPDGDFAHHEDVIALCDAIGAEKVWLVGASFGGGVALNTTLYKPERVRGLVLVDAAVSGWKGSATMQTFVEQEEVFMDAGDLEGATELNLQMWVDGPYRTPQQVDPDVRAKVGMMQMQAFQLPSSPSAKERGLEPVAIKRLQEVAAPTLVLVGTLDLPEFVTLAEQVAAEIPSAQLVRVEGAGHLPSMEQPDFFNQTVQEFLERNQE